MAGCVCDILASLSLRDTLSSFEFAKERGVDHQEIVGAIKSLQSQGNIINSEEIQSCRIKLTNEGKYFLEKGSHEFRIFTAIPEQGMFLAEVQKVDNGKIGLTQALAAKWIKIDKSHSNGAMVYRAFPHVTDNVTKDLKRIDANDVNSLSVETIKSLKRRKLIFEEKCTEYTISKGSAFTQNLVKDEVEITEAMLQDGSWKTKNFKPYKFDALGIAIKSGHLHPLLKVRSEFRKIFIEMGFSEMATNNYVESSFWNFDALFQPQQHPARDAHDTFFLSDPLECDHHPPAYLERVKRVHSEGGYESLGYQYDWQEKEARKNILRTHTTAVSARLLYALGQQNAFQPVKYFSIDRVFRNESLDATHLAEFHQIEGLIADRGLTLGHLKGIIHTFYKKMGLEDLRFKPAYNPYTEPSMEIFAYHPGLKKHIELGNSGIFRPEMLLPMGLPPDVTVCAWGLSLERPTMIKYGIKNIRDLIGPKVDLNVVAKAPICRMEK